MHADVGEAELDRLVDWQHAEKAMDLPYALIEDRKTALLRERIEMETQTGYNVYYYAVTAGGLVRYAVQIAAAVLLTFSLFRPGLLSAGAKLALLAGIVLTAVVSVLTGRRYGRLRSEFFAGCVDDNIRGESCMITPATIPPAWIFACTVCGPRCCRRSGTLTKTSAGGREP